MALNKMVNGVVVPMTPEEEVAFEASRAVPLDDIKDRLIESINNSIASAYEKWQRFSFEYMEREKAAREFKDAGYTGTPDLWVTAYADNIGQSNAVATDMIIAQADGLRDLLKTMGALRMRKYQISAAANEVDARSAHASIMSDIETVLATMP